MKEIPLTQGQVALVDDKDYETLSQHKWHAGKSYSHGTFYAQRVISKQTGFRFIRLHREILNPPPGFQVDHIDGNGLNNQRSNLRLASHTLNDRNNHRRKPTRLNLPRGVIKEGHRYAARIYIERKAIRLGTFNTPEEAHVAYLVARERLIAAACAALEGVQS